MDDRSSHFQKLFLQNEEILCKKSGLFIERIGNQFVDFVECLHKRPKSKYRCAVFDCPFKVKEEVVRCCTYFWRTVNLNDKNVFN